MSTDARPPRLSHTAPGDSCDHINQQGFISAARRQTHAEVRLFHRRPKINIATIITEVSFRNRVDVYDGSLSVVM